MKEVSLKARHATYFCNGMLYAESIQYYTTKSESVEREHDFLKYCLFQRNASEFARTLFNSQVAFARIVFLLKTLYCIDEGNSLARMKDFRFNTKHIKALYIFEECYP